MTGKQPCWLQGAKARMDNLPRETSYHNHDGTAQAWLAGWDAADAWMCHSARVPDQPPPVQARPDLPALWDLVREDVTSYDIVADPGGDAREAYGSALDAIRILAGLTGSKDIDADMAERDRVGRQRYGTPLQPFNGRQALVDAYQEALDLSVYLRQAIHEEEHPELGDMAK